MEGGLVVIVRLLTRNKALIRPSSALVVVPSCTGDPLRNKLDDTFGGWRWIRPSQLATTLPFWWILPSGVCLDPAKGQPGLTLEILMKQKRGVQELCKRDVFRDGTAGAQRRRGLMLHFGCSTRLMLCSPTPGLVCFAARSSVCWPWS